VLLYLEIAPVSGRRKRTQEPCFLDPTLPLSLLTEPMLVGVELGAEPGRYRVFHVEGNRYLDEERLGDAKVAELDTLRIVEAAAAA
jgi:hypothetical protein